jgi:oleate hydratase
MAKAYLVGSGIAALSAAVLLIREGGFAGRDVHLFEEQERLRGSLDAAGGPDSGYTMRGGRMFEAQFRCTYDLLAGIPSLEDSARSVTMDVFAAHEELGWDDTSRLVGADGKIIDAHAMGFSEVDRRELVKVLATPESGLDGKRIDDCFHPSFFTTNFWYVWCTTFAFEPWHSAVEFRRCLKRFVHLFLSFGTMTGIYRTRYHQYDSIVRPLLAWLDGQGVMIHCGHRVTDLAFAAGPGYTVRGLHYAARGRDGTIEVAPDDLVLVTNGSMTANASIGSHAAAPVRDMSRSCGAWRLWETLAAGRPDFGDPSVFAGHVEDSVGESFTVTGRDPVVLELMEHVSERRTGKAGLMTFPASNWLLATVLQRQPVFRDQPDDVFVWWGYGLFPDRPGNHVGKSMYECSGREILQEVLGHLPLGTGDRQRILDSSIVVPAVMPYITSQFLVRRKGDRPRVVPPGSTNLAFIGQFAEVPDDVVFTVEYSVRTAWTAVAELLKLDRRPPKVYKGQFDPRVLVHALETMHRR